MSFKLKSYTRNVNIVDNNNLQTRVFHILLLALGAFSLIYVLILGNMVFNIIARKSMEAQMLTLGNEVGDLELAYLSISNKVDLDLSTSLGFKETKVIYATRKALGRIGQLTNDL